MVEVRSDWARLLPTRPCRPSTGRDLVRHPDRDTTQDSHSRAEFMCRGDEPGLLAVDLQLRQGGPSWLHEFGKRVRDRGVVKT